MQLFRFVKTKLLNTVKRRTVVFGARYIGWIRLYKLKGSSSSSRNTSSPHGVEPTQTSDEKYSRVKLSDIQHLVHG